MLMDIDEVGEDQDGRRCDDCTMVPPTFWWWWRVGVPSPLPPRLPLCCGVDPGDAANPYKLKGRLRRGLIPPRRGIKGPPPLLPPRLLLLLLLDCSRCEVDNNSAAAAAVAVTAAGSPARLHRLADAARDRGRDDDNRRAEAARSTK